MMLENMKILICYSGTHGPGAVRKSTVKFHVFVYDMLQW